ncbi:hypothetical protein E4T56_gene14733 [Termitomyces sp. T112]|nr:hypothetical protein E4T56_gene14733 [Termitomyces sp. T112]KAH0588967.1 hypothetical protein H2248_004748 [Termitomyces sp. 'cryptogamus']KNZ72884.1 hypothetical protein J132_01876 [Termitomyces sp. J132]
MPVTVKWGKERIAFDLPAPDTPLYAVRRSLAEYTHLPPDAFKLVHAGAIMKDDNAPISAYHLAPNSTIALIGSTDPTTSPSERSVLSTIQSELNSVRSSLQSPLDVFLLAPTDQKEHTRLGELLLQALLRLDGIAAEPSWEHARKERKEAVREVQNMLDRLDNAWAARSL